MYLVEDLIEQIPEAKTKKLFIETYASYTHGNYRACIVMLWTTIICDLIYKLQYLSNSYSDDVSEKILAEIEQKQRANPKSPEWEQELIKLITKRTNLLTTIELDNLEYIRKQRNLSAHPILNDNDLLLNPTKELTRALLRIALDSVLLKSAILSKQFVDYMTEDLASKKENFRYDENGLINYVKSKFMLHLNDKQIKKLIKCFWRFVMNPKSQEELANIKINYSVLLFLSIEYSDLFKSAIEENPSHYNYSKSSQKYVVDLLKKSNYIYKYLDESVKILLKNLANNITLFFACPFLSDNIERHLNFVIEKIQDYSQRILPYIEVSDIVKIYELAKDGNVIDLFVTIAISAYCKAGCYDEADRYFEIFIEPYLSSFNEDKFLKLIIEADKNNQVYGRGRAYKDHKQVINEYIKKGYNIDKIKALNINNWNDILEDVLGDSNEQT